jgi:protein pelota
MNIKIEVQNINFDSGSCTLHISGVNVEENPHVRLGAYHTVHLELNRDFDLTKTSWDSISLERLNESTNPERAAEVAVIAMELGLAHLCLISGHMTITKAKLATSIPKKRSGASGHDKAIQRFYSNLYVAILKNIDFSKIKCVLIGSPGFVANDFMKSMMETAVKNNDRVIIEVNN